MIPKKTRAQKILETFENRQALDSDSKELFEREIELRRKELASILSKLKRRTPAAR